MRTLDETNKYLKTILFSFAIIVGYSPVYTILLGISDIVYGATLFGSIALNVIYILVMVIYGVIAYKLTKQIIIPSLFVLVPRVVVILPGLIINAHRFESVSVAFKTIISELSEYAVFPTVIALISSLITMIVMDIREKRIKDKPRLVDVSKKNFFRCLWLLLYLIALLLGMIICIILDYMYPMDYIGYSGMYILSVIPIALIIYGIISYFVTKNVLVPNLILFVFLLMSAVSITVAISIINKEIIGACDYIVGILLISGIPALVTTVISLFTMLISKIFKAAAKKQPTSDE